MTACYSCRVEAALEAQPASERIVVTDCWRVVHATGSRLPGWLCLVPRRHVESLAELSVDEAAELGPLLRDVSSALMAETGCVKTYAMLFAEASGYTHMHVHLVPRDADMPPELRGPNVFGYLGATGADEVPAEQLVALSRRLSARLQSGVSPWGRSAAAPARGPAAG